MPPQKNDYSQIIKRLRNKLGVSQEELARKIGVSYATLHRWENSKAKPSRLARERLNEFIEEVKRL